MPKKSAMVLWMQQEQGKRLHYLRLQSGATQQTVAAVLGVNTRTVVSIEKGRARLAGIDIALLCRFWDIPYDFLMLTPGAFIPPICRSVTLEQWEGENESIVNQIAGPKHR